MEYECIPQKRGQEQKEIWKAYRSDPYESKSTAHYSGGRNPFDRNRISIRDRRKHGSTGNDERGHGFVLYSNRPRYQKSRPDVPGSGRGSKGSDRQGKK